jgi:hypothetical protein
MNREPRQTRECGVVSAECGNWREAYVKLPQFSVFLFHFTLLVCPPKKLLPRREPRRSIAQHPILGTMAMNDYVLNKKPEPASNETVWAFDLGKGAIGEAVRRGNEFGASLLIPAEFAETKTAAGRRRMWRTRQAQGSHRPSPAGGGMVAAASGKEAPCRSSAAVPGGECGRRLAASSNTGRDARPTRRRDAGATRFTQDSAAPTALGRIELKIPIKFSTRFGNGRIPPN